MKEIPSGGLARATALTRAGKLQEATAEIQSLLNGQRLRSQPSSAHHDVLEGEFERIETGTEDEPERLTPRLQSRTRLSETLRRIAAGGMPPTVPASARDVPVPAGAQFLSLTHRSVHGSIGYRLYIPANRSDGPMPLVVMLHGCTQTPEDFATGTGMNRIAEEKGLLVAYPMQPSARNAQKCWNWFRPEDQVRGRGEPALIAGLASDILRDHGANPRRVYVAGLSAGAAAAVIVAAQYPDIFSAAGVHSGLPAGSAKDVPSAFSVMRQGGPAQPHEAIVPVIVFHGSQDATVHPQNAKAVVLQATEAMSGLSKEVVSRNSPGVRAFDRTIYRNGDGRPMAELWEIAGAGHAWMGGHDGGSYVDQSGPDASHHMIEFFLHHVKPGSHFTPA
jgi:poly(hydroxyalkanoate) depolymerase family esterase